MKRILLLLLLAWVGVAPSLAQACAGDCATRNIAQAAAMTSQDEAASMPNCHGVNQHQQDHSENQTHHAGMIAACVFAATASMSIPAFFAPVIETASRHSVTLQPSPASILPAPPDKPPQR